MSRNSTIWLDFIFINMSAAKEFDDVTGALNGPPLDWLPLIPWLLPLESDPWSPLAAAAAAAIADFSDSGHMRVGPKTIARFWICILFSSLFSLTLFF